MLFDAEEMFLEHLFFEHKQSSAKELVKFLIKFERKLVVFHENKKEFLDEAEFVCGIPEDLQLILNHEREMSSDLNEELMKFSNKFHISKDSHESISQTSFRKFESIIPPSPTLDLKIPNVSDLLSKKIKKNNGSESSSARKLSSIHETANDTDSVHKFENKITSQSHLDIPSTLKKTEKKGLRKGLKNRHQASTVKKRCKPKKTA